MSLDLHRQAELLMGLADQRMVEAKSSEAVALYRQAAETEARVFSLLPLDRPRTRGITAISAVALFRKAHALDQAIRHAYRYLADDLPEPARLDLEEMLDEMRAERLANASGRTLGEGSYEFALKGPGIGPGLAPLPLVARRIDQISRYGVRAFEYQIGAPLRRSGPVPLAVAGAFDMVMSQPYVGSFRFQVRFSTPPRQLPLFDSRATLEPTEIGVFFGQVLAAAASDAPGGLAGLVDDEPYRDALLRSVRAMLPDGQGLNEIDIIGQGRFASTEVRLTPALRKSITDQLPVSSMVRSGQDVHIDVLRGLNLNQGWILLGRDKESERKWYVREGVILADVVDGLLDQPVKVTGTRQRQRYIVDDLEAVEPDAPNPGAAAVSTVELSSARLGI